MSRATSIVSKGAPAATDGVVGLPAVVVAEVAPVEAGSVEAAAELNGLVSISLVLVERSAVATRVTSRTSRPTRATVATRGETCQDAISGDQGTNNGGHRRDYLLGHRDKDLILTPVRVNDVGLVRGEHRARGDAPMQVTSMFFKKTASTKLDDPVLQESLRKFKGKFVDARAKAVAE